MNTAAHSPGIDAAAKPCQYWSQTVNLNGRSLALLMAMSMDGASVPAAIARTMVMTGSFFFECSFLQYTVEPKQHPNPPSG
jgi:hypothetical protein